MSDLETKIDLPSSGLLKGEKIQYDTLFDKGASRTVVGNILFTSATSGYIYNTAGTIYNNQGENGLMLLLLNGDIAGGYTNPRLRSYMLLADDYNQIAQKIVYTSDLIFGANTINHTSKMPSQISAAVVGKNYTNTVGAFGNCESITPYTAVSGCTLSLDASKKVFGANALKITLTATTGIVSIPIGSTYNVAGYALLSAYLDKGTATNIKLEKDATGGGVSKSVISTDVTPTRQGVLIQPSDNNAGNLVKLTVTGTIGQVAYVDGILPTEISASEYAMSVSTVMGLYPYADSLAVTKFPSVKVQHPDGTIEQCSAEVSLMTGETGTFEDGIFKVPSKQWIVDVPLFGKDYDWLYSSDQTGTKVITAKVPFLAGNPIDLIGIKYDGKPLKNTAAAVADYTWWDNSLGQVLCVADADSGWAETIAPNADEVKAFMNGWKAVSYGVSTRYLCWYSIIDDSAPLGSISTLTTNISNAGQSTINVTTGTGTKFSELVAFKCSDGNWYTGTVANTTANTVVLTVNLGLAIPSGSTIIQCDNTSTRGTNINYCKANLAPNYPGYRLTYKLATPFSKEYPIKGKFPELQQGINTVSIDTGTVLGEPITPQLGGGNYLINSNDLPLSCARNKMENFGIYKNGVLDNANWIFLQDSLAYGTTRAYRVSTNHDTTANYTIDGRRLNTESPQIGTQTLSYKTGILDAVQDVFDQMGNKQGKDAALDRVVSLAEYEVVQSYSVWNWFTTNNDTVLWLHRSLPCVQKNILPKVSIKALNIAADGILDAYPQVNLQPLGIYRDHVHIFMTITNASYISIIKSKGCYGNLDLIIDARGGRP